MEIILPSERDNFLSEVQKLGNMFLSLLIEEKVVPLPVEDEFAHAPILEGSHEHPDLDIGDIGCLMGLAAELLLDCNHAFLE